MIVGSLLYKRFVARWFCVDLAQEVVYVFGIFYIYGSIFEITILFVITYEFDPNKFTQPFDLKIKCRYKKDEI